MNSALEIEVQKFLSSIPEKYPHLRGKLNQTLFDAVVAEMRAIGIYREDVTAQSFHVGVLSAMQNGTIPSPPPQVVERIVEKVPEPKSEPQLSAKQIRESTGIGTTGGRKNHAHQAEENLQILTAREQQIISATEKSAQAYVERNFNHPPTGNNHSERDNIRDRIKTIVQAEAHDPIARWARTALRVQDEVLAEFDRSIR